MTGPATVKKRVSKLRIGDKIMGYPMSPLYVRAAPTPARRDHKQIGWRVRLVTYAPLIVSGDPEVDVIEATGDSAGPEAL